MKHLSNQKETINNTIEASSIKNRKHLDNAISTTMKEPIHPFTLKYWPLTKPVKVEDTSTLEHDSSLNSFDIIKNKKTLLALDLNFYDSTITVVDSSVLNVGNKQRNLPGIIYVGGERIEFFTINENVPPSCMGANSGSL
jgi:hypothetical protein